MVMRILDPYDTQNATKVKFCHLVR
uniref:Uncharacterized protein n=1 Tax=Rhizophora mucronata TaxID=61149 RepID=A0A2P2QED3_RHIMU